ncbi:MAG: TolC family protein [Magnetospirillum sp. WYHS-4]
MMRMRLGLLAAVAGFALVLASPVLAESDLKKALTAAMSNHARIKQIEASVAASQENIEVERGAWYPKFDLTTYYGHEQQKKGAGVADTHLPARSVDTKVTQQIYDFGVANANIDKADLKYQIAVENGRAVRQKLIFDGVQAYLEVIKASKTLDFARGSEENVKRQTELEDALVQKGAGYSTDVLQAKTQLAEARTRRVQAEGTLRVALNKYRGVFDTVPTDLDRLVPPRTPLELIPEKIETVIDLAMKEHPQLRATHLEMLAAKEDVSIAYSSKFGPKLNGVAQSKWKNDDAGTIGSKIEQIVKVEMTYDFNLGFTALNSIRAAKHTETGAESRYVDQKGTIEEQSRTAWDNLLTARENAEHFRNMANIAAEYLSLARKERQLGRRSLIDVLAGETSLINANSDATAAEMDVAVAAYTLMLMMGKLDLSLIE